MISNSSLRYSAHRDGTLFICYCTIYQVDAAKKRQFSPVVQRNPIPVRPNPVITHSEPHLLQFGLSLRLLEDGVQLGGLHDIALDLKLAGHE